MRKDYFRDLWTYIAPGRALRPFDSKGVAISDREGCFFCPGNEHTTPPEIDRASKNGNKDWQVRVFPNKFPICGGEDISKNGWKTWPSYGRHEVIVETPDHYQKVSEITVEELVMTLRMYRERINALENDPGIEYVSVFKNQGREAGASLDHSHTQILAVSQIPSFIKEKMEYSKKGDCAYCKIAEEESASERTAFVGEHFVAFCPFAPRYTHELWIVAKSHVRNMNDLTDEMLTDLADIMLKSLKAIEKLTPNYNMMVNYGPKGSDFHFHIEIAPRVPHQVKAGFELGTNYAVITTSPEETASYYREHSCEN
jgi:UDPglucose--hexose-1-phosphate uridylyltransferase